MVLLVAALLYLNQYQNGLLEAEVTALREQARVFAGALGESAVSLTNPKDPKLIPDIARPLLYRLTDPTPDADAKLYAPDGSVVVNSRVREQPGGAVRTEPLPPPVEYGPIVGTIGWLYDKVLSLLPYHQPEPLEDTTLGEGLEWQPDVKDELRLNSSGQSNQMPPYIRRTKEGQLLVTVAEPVEHEHHTVGIIVLTREAREVDASVFAVRISVLGLFGLALALTVLLSWYMSRTIARPILRLADVTRDMREGQGRAGIVPASLLARRDEVGALASALSDSAEALWARMDAIERFAADVAHEIKNPLSSIRSAIETLRRIEDPVRQRQLLAIMAQDVTRLDRLITDVSDASRLDAELSRIAPERIDVVPLLRALADLDEATRDTDNDPKLLVEAPRAPDGLGGGGPAGAGAAQPDRQRAVVQPTARAHLAAGAGGGRAGGIVRGRPRPRHSGGQPGACVRPVLFRAAEDRTVRPALGAGAVDQPADRGGAARLDRRREPEGQRWRGDGRAVRGAVAEGVTRPLPDPCAAGRVPPHPLLWLPRQLPPGAQARALPRTAWHGDGHGGDRAGTCRLP